MGKSLSVIEVSCGGKYVGVIKEGCRRVGGGCGRRSWSALFAALVGAVKGGRVGASGRAIGG